MNKFTEGPWEMDACAMYIFGPKSETIAEIRGYGAGLPMAENGKLLAAAPTLLKALKVLLAESGVGTGISENEIRAIIGNTNWECLRTARKYAEAAIWEAEGGLVNEVKR